MSLARAFTKRMKRSDESGPSSLLGRSNTLKYTPGTIDRTKISLPTELLSTTNVHALTAPDVNKVINGSSSSSSTHSGNDSDFSTIDRSFLSSNGDDSTPATPITPPMEAKDFFDRSLNDNMTPPEIPKRVPSHSKRAHMELSRKRSMQRMSPPPTTITRTPSVRNSADIFGARQDTADHPFGAELAKVNEVAEEFGATKALIDEEEQFMLVRGLCKYGVEDYINEIAVMCGGVYEDNLGPIANPWI